MAEAANAVEEYVELQQRGRWRRLPAERLELVRKTYAQQLARSASRTVKDRRSRAEVKAEFYQHLLPLLELHASVQHSTHQRYRKLILSLSIGLLLTTALAVLALLNL